MIYIYRRLAWWLECSPMVRETWVQSLVESYQRLKKWYLVPPCLKLSIIRYRSRVKWSNSGNGLESSPTHQCSSYLKGSFRVTLDYGHQLYLLMICIWPIGGTLTGTTSLSQSGPWCNGYEGVLHIPQSCRSSHYDQIVYCYIQDTRWEEFYHPSTEM